jgi:replicative DNA helicase
VLTGLRLFDERVGGLFPSELVILAARPGLGKTSLAAQVALWNGERDKLVYFASLEMSAAQQTLRLLCGRAIVSSKLVRTGRVSPEHGRMLADESNAVASASVWFDDRPALRVNDIRRATLVLASYFFRAKDSQQFEVTAIVESGALAIPQGIPATVDRVIQRYKRHI